MSGINRWHGFMNLGADPELRFTQSGTAVLNMRGACNEKYKDRDGVDKEIVTWIPCVVWGARAEGLAKVLRKGERIYVEGPLRVSTYDDKDGIKRTKFEVEVRELEFAGSNKSSTDSADRGAPRDTRPSGGGRPAAPRGQAPARPAAQTPAADDYDTGGGYGGGMDDDGPF